MSKKDFIDQLENFLAKEKKTTDKNSETKEVVTDKEEIVDGEATEESFEDSLHINLVDLNLFSKQLVEIKTETDLLGGSDELPTEEVAMELQTFINSSEELSKMTLTNLGEVLEVEDLMFELEDLLKKDQTAGTMDSTNRVSQTQIEGFLLEIQTQLSEHPDLEVKDIIESLSIERESALGEILQEINFEGIENISYDELVENLTNFESESHNLELTEDAEVNIQSNEFVDEEVTIEQVEVKDSELVLENVTEGQAVELSTIETFEPVNRGNILTEIKAPIQSVSQEDFISTIETLMIDETNAIDGGEKISTARIQLTPEHLGKVDVHIEMNGKELTAKMFVEQKDTKEWIDQQVAHLKEKLLTQEITVKDFQVVVHEENLNDAFMSSEDNPFFKQKEKDSQAQKQQRILKKQTVDVPVQREERSYSTRNGISILV